MKLGREPVVKKKALVTAVLSTSYLNYRGPSAKVRFKHERKDHRNQFYRQSNQQNEDRPSVKRRNQDRRHYYETN